MPENAPFPNLFRPLQIGAMTVRNRIVMTAHGTRFAARPEGGDPVPSLRNAYYLAERAKGGIGLIIMEAASVHPSTETDALAKVPAYKPELVDFFRPVTAMVHQHGARLLCQLSHNGSATKRFHPHTAQWAPSPVRDPRLGEIPHEMDTDEIAELVAYYGLCTEHLVAAGFDGVEVHAGHGYLLQQFLSPLANLRTDAYGGTLENRLRFVQEVLHSVRAAAGRDHVIGIRVSGDEFTAGGLTLADMQVICERLAASGLLDYISVTQSSQASYVTQIPDMAFPQGPFVYLAAGIKSRVPNLPVITVGRITTPAMAEEIVASGKADLVAMTRAMIADPELSNKAQAGRVHEIRYCIGCSQGCAGRAHAGKPLSCIYNPEVGYEQQLGIGTLQRADQPQRVVVVGGGPAGLEAARMAAMRGHHVTLFERDERLGGQINLISVIPHRKEWEQVVTYEATQLELLGVEIRLGQAATPDVILAESPDVVIVATGSRPEVPTLPTDGTVAVVNSRELLAGTPPVDKKIVVLDAEYDHHAASVAEFLLDQGNEVQVVTKAATIGRDITPSSLAGVFGRLYQKGAVIWGHSKVARLEDSAVIVANAFSSQENIVASVDQLLAVGFASAEDSLYGRLKGVVPRVYRIGDALAPRKAMEALHEGYHLGRSL